MVNRAVKKVFIDKRGNKKYRGRKNVVDPKYGFQVNIKF